MLTLNFILGFAIILIICAETYLLGHFVLVDACVPGDVAVVTGIVKLLSHEDRKFD